MNIANWLHARARAKPSAPALLRGTNLVADYARFAALAAALGAEISSALAIRQGDRVAVLLPNSPEYLVVLYGIWWAGAVAVPVNHKLHAREVAWILRDADASGLFTDEQSATNLAALDDPGIAVANIVTVAGADSLPAPMPGAAPAPLSLPGDALAWLFYTSGTTGSPKGVMLSHTNLTAMSLSYLADVDPVSADDHALYAAPMSHGAGLYNFIHVRMGARHVTPESGGFQPSELMDLAPRLGNVSLFAAPTMVRRLVDAARAAEYRGEGIKTIVYGGGPMYRADLDNALAQFGQRFVQIYGQGESPMTITALARDWHADDGHPRFEPRIASVGRAQSVVEVRITDPQGRPVPAGEAGEIEVRGATVMAGYWNNPEASARTLANGWLKTGDLGILDEDGFLTLSDRSKDVIISGGSNIYPREVEEVLLAHPAIREVAVVGRPSAQWGEEVVACVVCDPPAPGDAELDRLCLARIARFKRPKAYVFMPSLPKNNYGKILKTELRKSLGACRV